MFVAPNKFNLPDGRPLSEPRSSRLQLRSNNQQKTSNNDLRAITLSAQFNPNAFLKRRNQFDNHLLPVIDTTGQLTQWADAYIPQGDPQSKAKSLEIVQAFQKRRSELADWVINSKDDDIRLLAHLYVAQTKLTPVYDPNEKRAIRYNRNLPIPNIRECDERLAQAGYVKRQFFDRLHTCPNCDSSRLNVREECLSCRSGNVEEQAILHHFRCAYQGPSSDFAKPNDHLECPKCKRELKHYGTDYERSGFVMTCHSCKASNSGVAIGFVCLDCHHHHDGETMPSITISSYELTSAGVEYLRCSIDNDKDMTQILQNIGLPLKMAISLQQLLSKPEGSVFTLMSFSYQNEKSLSHALGVEAFEKLRLHAFYNLENIIGAHGETAMGQNHDYVLLSDVPPTEVMTERAFFIEQCQKELGHNLDIDIQIFGPEDFNGL